jgi:hypothetical protein
MKFASLEDAQAACIEHLRTFGLNPDSNKRLKEGQESKRETQQQTLGI